MRDIKDSINRNPKPVVEQPIETAENINIEKEEEIFEDIKKEDNDEAKKENNSTNYWRRKR